MSICLRFRDPRILLVVGFMLAVGACAREPEDESGGELTFEIVRSLGTASLDEANRPFSDVEREYQGSVFGRVTAIDFDLAGNLYALDPQFRKVVVFDSSGRMVRLIPLPNGTGPGEFGRVRSLAVRGDGSVLILDSANNRISDLNPTGEYVGSHVIDGFTPFEIWAPDEERVFVSRRYTAVGTPALMEFDRDWSAVDSLFFASEADADRGSHGEWGDLLIAKDGTVMFAPVIPGIWLTGDGTTLGSPMYPEARGQIQEFSGARYFPVASRGSALLSDGSVLQYYWQFAGPAWTQDSEEPFLTPHLVRVSLTGGGPEPIDLPFETDDTQMWPSQKPDHILFVLNDPYPRIVELRVSLGD